MRWLLSDEVPRMREETLSLLRTAKKTLRNGEHLASLKVRCVETGD